MTKLECKEREVFCGLKEKIMQEKFREYSQKYLQVNRGKVVVFDAKELPFFTVAPQFSELGENFPVGKEFGEKYPDISFAKSCLADGAILIQDIGSQITGQDSTKQRKILNQKVEKLNIASNITLQVVDGFDLTQNLLETLLRENVLQDDTLIVIPGNGAKVVSDYINQQSSILVPERTIFLKTKRIKQKDGFNVSVDFSPLSDRQVKNILIIDDVVSTGQTASTIAKGIKERFPQSRCLLAAWLFVSPSVRENQKTGSGVSEIDKTYTSIILKGNYVGKPPINSLSCFIRSGTKYDEVKENFMQKYIRNPEEFIDIINSLKGGIC